jgi:hypothetical protein
VDLILPRGAHRSKPVDFVEEDDARLHFRGFVKEQP